MKIKQAWHGWTIQLYVEYENVVAATLDTYLYTVKNLIEALRIDMGINDHKVITELEEAIFFTDVYKGAKPCERIYTEMRLMRLNKAMTPELCEVEVKLVERKAKPSPVAE